MRPVMLLMTSILILIILSSSPLAAETIQWIPAAASSPGLFGSVWTTDLWIYNRVADRSITVYLAFLPEQDGIASPVEVSVEIPVLDRVDIQDVVGSLFADSRAGAIRLRSEHEFEARSRTFNTGGDVGTFGQGIPAIASSALRPAVILLGASHAPTGNGTRTNLGVLNPNSEPIRPFVFVYGDTLQDVLGQARVELGPLGWWQGNVFDLIGETAAVENAMVFVFGFDIDEPVISYLSVVDNASGDGTYLEAVDGIPAHTEPLDWTIGITVTATDATLNQMTVTIDDTEPEVFADLSNEVIVTLESHVGRFEMCYAVDATAIASGRVHIDIRAETSYGYEGGSSSSSGGSGEFTVERCQWISPQARLDP